jgi:hypothetical protein
MTQVVSLPCLALVVVEDGNQAAKSPHLREVRLYACALLIWRHIIIAMGNQVVDLEVVVKGVSPIS